MLVEYHDERKVKNKYIVLLKKWLLKRHFQGNAEVACLVEKANLFQASVGAAEGLKIRVQEGIVQPRRNTDDYLCLEVNIITCIPSPGKPIEIP